ncbi:MAG: hypothetical protein ABFC89_01965 [Methanospirillum sp.]
MQKGEGARPPASEVGEEPDDVGEVDPAVAVDVLGTRIAVEIGWPRGTGRDERRRGNALLDTELDPVFDNDGGIIADDCVDDDGARTHPIPVEDHAASPRIDAPAQS